MRLILQRVARAAVEVDGKGIASIGRGLLVLAGIEAGDEPEQVDAAAKKLIGLRIFADTQGRMNLDIATAGGSILLVSQFTLAGSLDKGRRPSFERAASPDLAAVLIDELAARLRQMGVTVATGSFGAYMQVELVNDGPVTFVLDFPPAGQ